MTLMLSKFESKLRTIEAENWQKFKNSQPELKCIILVFIKKKKECIYMYLIIRTVAWLMLPTNIFLIDFYLNFFCMFFSTKQHQYECMNLLKEQLNSIAEIKRKQNFIRNCL